MNPPREQRGSTLLEALISILIFSFGILAIVGLQAYSVKATSEAKYRMDASLLADQIIGRMWSDKGNLAAYASGGAQFVDWRDNAVASALPGVAANPPTVTVGAGNTVTVQISWKGPGDSGLHKYVVTTQIN